MFSTKRTGISYLIDKAGVPGIISVAEESHKRDVGEESRHNQTHKRDVGEESRHNQTLRSQI